MPLKIRPTYSRSLHNNINQNIMDINSRIQELTKLTSSDYDAEYWKTTRMDMHLDQKSAWVYLAGYKDEAAFDAGLMPVTTQRIKVIEDLTDLI